MTASWIHRAQARACALVMVLAVCSTLAACGADSPAAEKQQPILTEKSVITVWKDYDKANNAAMAEAGPPSYDGTAYDVADVGPLLEQDITSAKVKEFDRGKRSTPFHTSPKELYAPVESAGFALSTTVESDDEESSNQNLTSIVPIGDPATWKLEMSVEVQRPKALPRPLEPGSKSTASKADVEQARELVTSVSEYWRTLRKPTGIAVGLAAYADFAKSHAEARKSEFDVTSRIVPEGISTTPGAGEALRVVRAKGGLLVLANVRVRSILETHQDGITITLSGWPRKLFGAKPLMRSRLHWSSTLAISVPDGGTATVLGVTVVPLVK